MIETELKFTLDAAGEARLRRHPAFEAMRLAPRRTRELVSIYFDTPEQALAAAGISLRLRKVGRRWIQTIKRRAGAVGEGLFSNHETECAAPGGRLVLTGADPAFAAVAAARGETPLAPLFETRVRRVIEHLSAPGGGEVELALDRGSIVAGERTAPILEAELELKAGDTGAVFEVARVLFDRGPVRLAATNKSARGYALVRGDVADGPLAPRMAGDVECDPSASVETVARDVLRDCFAQISRNMVLVAESEMVEGPHQLRVGLRRLRTAFKVFSPSFGGDAAAPLNDEARRLGQVVSGLRDLDVLIGDVVKLAELGLDDTARDALLAALREMRAARRAEVRVALAAPEAVGFLFDLGRFIEARGWLAPSDYDQTTRLAAPIAEVAPTILAARRRKAMKLGRDVESLDSEALHTLRKELKTLRYAAEMFDSLFPARKVGGYLRALKDIQDSFGSMTDAAMAEIWLTGPKAPGHASPSAQRAAGWVLGALAAKVRNDRPNLFERWQRLAKADPFWS